MLEPECNFSRTCRSISRDDALCADPLSPNREEDVSTGNSVASGGKSHSCVRPTTSFPAPIAKSISVALGSKLTIRMRKGSGENERSLQARNRRSMLAPPARALFTALIDYAGLYPPVTRDMQAAVSEYDKERSGSSGWMLGRFIIAASRIEELLQEINAYQRRTERALAPFALS